MQVRTLQLKIALVMAALLWPVDAHAAIKQAVVTSYVRMTNELSDDVARTPRITMTSIGRSMAGGRDIWLVRVAGDHVDTTRTVRLMVLCRQHGDEPASTEAVLGMLGRIADGKDENILHALKNVTLYIVPMVNPDGAEANTRLNGSKVDLNRDWGKFTQRETQAVRDAVDAIRPHVIVDAHNWDFDDPHPYDCIESPLLSPNPLVEADRSLQSDAVQSLDDIGYQVHPTGFGPKNDPHLAHRYFFGQGLISMLVETHPGNSENAVDFDSRKQMYVALIHTLVRTLAHDADFRRQALDKLEGYRNYKSASAEKALFARSTAVASAPTTVVAETPSILRKPGFNPLLWLLPIGAFVFLGIAMKLSASPSKVVAEEPTERWNKATAPGRSPSPASEAPSTSRRGKPPYRGSTY